MSHKLFIVSALTFAILYLLFAFRGLLETFLHDAVGPIHQLILLVIYAFFSIWFVAYFRTFNRQGLRLLSLFIGYNLLTLLWSSSVGSTVGAMFGLIGTTFVGGSLAVFWGTSSGPKIAMIIFGYIMISLLFFGVGLDVTLYKGYIFQGFSGHKNLIGNMSGLAAVIFYMKLRTVRKFDWMTVLAILMTLIALFISQASTSIVAMALTLVFVELAVWRKRLVFTASLYGVISVTVLLFIVFLASAVWVQALAFLGESATLSSRTLIWAGVLDEARNNFWFGSGFGALWAENSPVNLRLQRVFAEASFKQAHNGFIDLYGQSGFVGLVLGIACVFGALKNLYNIGLVERRPNALLAGVIFLIFNNLGEANLFVPNYFSFAFLTLALLLKPQRNVNTYAH